MNLLIPHSWVKEFCTTSLTPEKIAALVSLSGPSIDRVMKKDSDVLYDAEITTNRPDAYSIVGFAREVAAILRVSFKEVLDEKTNVKKILEIRKKAKTNVDTRKAEPYALTVDIQSPNLCHRYIGAVLDHVVVGPSPVWMTQRLERCGLRSINNVVDITNYVMLEYGQPMHAFDADKLVSIKNGQAELFHKKIIVRNARKGEHLITLDGNKKALKESMLVIADDQGPLALAGIKGGERAGIDQKTHTVILEAAYFDPITVRTTSRLVDLRTDSSSRFEKNLSQSLPPFAITRASELLEKYAQARVVSPLIDQYPIREKPRDILFSPHAIKRILGVSIEAKEVKRCLNALGFGVKAHGSSFKVSVPFWRRADVEKEIDLIEEVARLHGYTRLPVESLRGAIPLSPRDPSFSWEQEAKHHLKDTGWTEVMTYSFVSAKVLEKAGIPLGACIRVTNPLSLEFEFMRPSLLPSILEVIANNEHKSDSLKVFELATVYVPVHKNKLPHEPLMLVGALTGKKKEHDLFLELKGALETLSKELFGKQSDNFVFETEKEAIHGWTQGKTAVMRIGTTLIARCGIPKESLVSAFGIKVPVGLFEFYFSENVSSMSGQRSFAPLPKYPSASRDIAFILDKRHTFESIQSALNGFHSLIRGVELFDVFENVKLGTGKQSLALHVTYCANDRTLLTQEVDDIHEKLRLFVRETFQAELR